VLYDREKRLPDCWMKILFVEDDRFLGDSLSKILTAHHYTVDRAAEGETGLEMALQGNYDLIVLDIQLPNLDGISICRRLRMAGKMTPILILTAIDTSERIVDGFDTGADDYVVKPFEPEQLLARIRALCRRGSQPLPAPVLKWGELQLDPTSAIVSYGRKTISVRPKEYSLLELFLRHPQRIFTRDAIIDRLWTSDDCPTEHAVTNLIKDLRQRLKNAGVDENPLETVYGQGYRLKSPSSGKGFETDDTSQESPASEGLEPLHRLEKEFQASLGERIENFQTRIRAIASGEGDRTLIPLTVREAHRLVGSLGTFGYGKGSEIARDLERILSEVGESGQIPSTRLENLVTELLLATASSPSSIAPKLGTVLVVGRKAAAVVESLRLETGDRGKPLETVPDRDHLWQTLGESLPDAIALILTATEREADFQTLSELSDRYGNLPVLVIAEEDRLEDRVRASHCGGKGYLALPVTASRFWSAIADLERVRTPIEARVLIVEDDPLALATLSQLFRERSIEVTGLSDPDRFWQVLTATNPDLLLLDLQMPHFNGIELCRVTRQDPDYADLPIVFVSAHNEPATISAVFAAGADDFIPKPSIASSLVTRSLSHLERARLQKGLTRSHRQQWRKWQRLAYLDPLTQVANRRAFDETLQREWYKCSLSERSLSLLLCDIDHFKLYNDRYGHPAGDICLQKIATALQDCLVSTGDMVARYGGEEFAIILPDTSLNGALAVAERVRIAIAALAIPNDPASGRTQVTVSLGIAGRVPTTHDSPEILVETADQALYTAKKRGRNTYCLYCQ
jgi:diguanylate cyclase (GGDEF)-like protein